MPIKLTLITSIMPFACIFGIFLSPCLAKVGKRKAFMILDIGSIIGTLLCITGNKYMLIVGRFIQGMFNGLSGTIFPIYNKQISPQ